MNFKKIIRLVLEVNLVFSWRGRILLLWGLIIRRSWLSMSFSKIILKDLVGSMGCRRIGWIRMC